MVEVFGTDKDVGERPRTHLIYSVPLLQFSSRNST